MKILSLIMLTTLMSLTFGQSSKQLLLFNDDDYYSWLAITGSNDVTISNITLYGDFPKTLVTQMSGLGSVNSTKYMRYKLAGDADYTDSVQITSFAQLSNLIYDTSYTYSASVIYGNHYSSGADSIVDTSEPCNELLPTEGDYNLCNDSPIESFYEEEGIYYLNHFFSETGTIEVNFNNPINGTSDLKGTSETTGTFRQSSFYFISNGGDMDSSYYIRFTIRPLTGTVKFQYILIGDWGSFSATPSVYNVMITQDTTIEMVMSPNLDSGLGSGIYIIFTFAQQSDTYSYQIDDIEMIPQSYLSQCYRVLRTEALTNGTVNITDSTVKKNTILQVIATPSTGYAFNGWLGDTNETNDTISVLMNEGKGLVARFTKTPQIVRVIVSGTDAQHDALVKQSFIDGYESTGGTWTDSIETRLETLQQSYTYADTKGAGIIIRSYAGASTYTDLASTYLPTMLFMPAGSNSHTQVYNTGGNLPNLILTGAANPDTNVTAWDVEFTSIDPQANVPALSSFSNAYIAGVFAYIQDHTTLTLSEIRMALRTALGGIWTPQEGYGKITTTIINEIIP